LQDIKAQRDVEAGDAINPQQHADHLTDDVDRGKRNRGAEYHQRPEGVHAAPAQAANQPWNREARHEPDHADHGKQQTDVTRIAEQVQRLHRDHCRQQRPGAGFDCEKGGEDFCARALLCGLQP
jgi:hypothetical protein